MSAELAPICGSSRDATGDTLTPDSARHSLNPPGSSGHTSAEVSRRTHSGAGVAAPPQPANGAQPRTTVRMAPNFQRPTTLTLADHSSWWSRNQGRPVHESQVD